MMPADFHAGGGKYLAPEIAIFGIKKSR